ncbi:hypothetical protein [Actinomyces oricola]
MTTGSHFYGPASTTATIEDAARQAGYVGLVTPVLTESRPAVGATPLRRRTPLPGRWIGRLRGIKD